MSGMRTGTILTKELIKEYRLFSFDFCEDVKSNLRIYDRYKDAKKRCNDKNCKDYRYYGARGIKVELTRQEWALILKKEIFKIIQKGYYRSVDEVLDTHEVDRIKGLEGYKKGNVRLIESFCNWHYTQSPAKHLRLTDELDVPLCVFDILLDKIRKFHSTRVRTRLYLSLPVLFLDKYHNPTIPLLYYDLKKPPYILKKSRKTKNSGYSFDCDCGRTHRIDFKERKVHKYKCGLTIDLNPTYNQIRNKLRFKPIEPNEFKMGLKYIEKLLEDFKK